jgi:hypothetical protein
MEEHFILFGLHLRENSLVAHHFVEPEDKFIDCPRLSSGTLFKTVNLLNVLLFLVRHSNG